MRRAIVNVSTGHFALGLKRLYQIIYDLDLREMVIAWDRDMPPGSPPHAKVPYGFKIWALEEAARRGYNPLLWCDSSICPLRSLDPIWDYIHEHGYWFSRYYDATNGDFCADEALPILGVTRGESYRIPQVVATAFGLDLEREESRMFLAEWKRLALAGAFAGDYGSSMHGHRHDQTAASVVVHRLGWKLTTPPMFWAECGQYTNETILATNRIR